MPTGLLLLVSQFTDDNGIPLNSGKVYTYEAGTSTPLPTYTSSSAVSQLANPVVLDTDGRPNNGNGIFMDASYSYKLVVKDSNDNTIFTWDPVNPSSTLYSPADAQYVVLTGNSTLSAERVLTGTANQITITDGGAGGNVTLSIPYNLDLGSSATGPSEIDFFEDTDNGSNKITLKAPASVGSDATITLPTATGTLLVGTNNLSDVSNAGTARSNLGLVIGTNVAAAGTNTDITSIYLNNTGLKVKDTDASHGLKIVPGSNLTADKTLTITTGDSDRTFTISGDTTVSGTNTGDQDLSTYYKQGGTDVAVTDGGTGLSTLTTAYGVVCAGTTATGALQNAGAGTAGQVFTSGGASALPSWSTGSLVLLSTQSATNSSSIDFTSVFSSTYRSYLIEFSGVIPANSSSLYLHTRLIYSTNTIETGSVYDYSQISMTTASGTYSAYTAGGTTSSWLLNPNATGGFWADSTSLAGHGYIIVQGTQTAATTSLISQMTYYNNDNGNSNNYPCHCTTTGMTTSTNVPYTGIRFLFGTGNITSGVFKLYGISG